MVAAFPLSWPAGRPRTPPSRRKRATFNNHGRPLTVFDSMLRLRREVELLGAANLVVSTDVPTRRDGDPRSGVEPSEPGAACYFSLPMEDGSMVPTCLACDRWDRVPDNLAAIAAHVDATRGILRWGVGDVAQAFAGYRQLPAMGASRPWWDMLGFPKGPPETDEDVYAEWISRLQQNHPDKGGAHDAAAELNRAWDEAQRYYQGAR